MIITESIEYFPAKTIFNRVNYAGQVVNNYKILGFVESRRASGGTLRHWWLAECVKCNTKVKVLKNSIMDPARNNNSGCASCHTGRKRSGPLRNNWRGGEVIPGKFLSTVRNRLVRKSKTLDFDLDIAYLEIIFKSQEGKCVYTGRDLKFSESSRRGETTASLDRIDSSKGYIKGNVQFVHKDINKLKMDYPEDIFIQLCKEVTDFRRLKENE